MLFLSTYINRVDKKGRVSVPVAFRAALSTQAFSGIVAYKSFINPCIEACGFNRIEFLSQTIDALDPYSEARDAFATTILGEAIQMPFDGEGRVILSEELMVMAKIDDKACFVGKGATFEIWTPEVFEEYAANAREIAKQNRSLLQFNSKMMQESGNAKS